MPDHIPNDDVFFRYLAGDVSPAEAARVEAWIAERPRRRETVEQLRRDLELRREELHRGGERLEHAWLRVAARLESGAEATASPHRDGDVRRVDGGRSGDWRRWGLGVAAALVLAAGLAKVAGRGPEPGPVAAADTAALVYATASGQRTQVTLPDGSTITLSVQSVLRVPRDFGRARSRTVELEGEGFFQVAPDSSRPFTVRAGDALTRVLGTEFDVRAYPHERQVAVVVRNGKVGVARRGTTAGVLLTRGMGATVGPDSVRVATADLENTLAWLTGTLRVRNRAVGDLLPELERWYGIRLQLAEPRLASRRVTTTFDAGARDADLGRLAALLNARLAIQDSVMVFIPQR